MVGKTSTSIGRQAEAAVADFLNKRGHKIIAQNWRTRQCEIDIVAQKDKTVYFVEVKYRASDGQGGGAEYVTAAKLKQMVFAAEVWVSQNDWTGDWQLLVADVSGNNFEQIELIEV